MFKYAKQLLRQRILWDAVVMVERGLRTPADAKGGHHVSRGPIKDLCQFGPVIDRLEIQVFDGRAGDDEAVEALVAHRLEGAIMLEQVIGAGVAWFVAGSPE